MAPDNPQLLLEQLSNKSKVESKISKQVDNLLEQVSMQYLVAANDRERNEVLSQIANSFPLNTLQNYFPFLTRNRYSKARKTAALRTIMWITVGLPFGSQKVKYSSGEKVEIPNTIRKHTANELCLMFDSLMIEIGRPDVKLSRSLKFKLIKICKASKRIATQCVDYYAFEMLQLLLENVSKNNSVEESWTKETKYLLQQAEHYLKTDYRIHIKLYSRCADHCITFALSDPNNKKYSSIKCSEIKHHEHEHDLKCERCLYFPEVIRKIQSKLDELFSNLDGNSDLSDKLLEFKDIVDQCETKIENLKMHILRSVLSDMERASMIENLKEGEAFITMDYAQKFIPRKSNQPQRDYYAQKGLSWHMSHVFAVVKNTLVQHSVTHLMGFEKQSAKSVITITRDLLEKLKFWQINVVTFRSDNASNYRNIDLMINLFAMSMDIGIRIKRYSFSEVQNGKASGDMETSRHKRRMRNSLDAGNNIETPDAMYNSLQYGTHPLCAATIVIASVNGPDCESKKSLNGITKISDFVFDYENKRIRFWQHFNIGRGETIDFQEYKSLILNAELKIYKETTNTPDTQNYIFWRSSQVAASESTKESTANIPNETDENIQIDPEEDYINPSKLAIFFCPENGCQKSFKTYGYLDRHIRIGRHLFVPERCTVQDYALNAYRQCIEGASASVSLPQLPELLENLASADETNLKQGWAIRERATRVLYTPDMKAFLDKEFETSQSKNQRINPKIVQEKMAEFKTVNGKSRFKVAERLTSIQIGRYFAAKLKKLREEIDDTDAFDDDLLHDEPMFSDIFEAIFDEIDWSTLIPPGKEEGEWDDSEEEEEIQKKKTPKKTTPKTPNKVKQQKTPTPKENQQPS
uniref:C2H2-type domain-containing protein n=1 Tax=Panagrolaimus sp. ES5 TaxID=591445 RepID=A0AC34FZH4_9BILA